MESRQLILISLHATVIGLRSSNTDCLLVQVDQDIIRGRLGRGHRRDSSAQITTIDTDTECGAGAGAGLYGGAGAGQPGNTTPPLTSKRRRSSLAQLGDFIQVS